MFSFGLSPTFISNIKDVVRVLNPKVVLKIFHLQLSDVKLSFSGEIYLWQAEENGCHGCASLFSVIKFKRKNDDFFKAYSNKVLKHRTLCSIIQKCLSYLNSSYFLRYENLWKTRDTLRK